MRSNLSRRLGAVLALCVGLRATAGTFVDNFDSGLATNASVYGNAVVEERGGVNRSGALKLTMAKPNQMGSFVLNALDGKKGVSSFIASFKAYVGGGTGADGFAFHFAANIPNAPFADSISSGLSLMFDTYKNGAQIAPGIRMHSPKARTLEVAVPKLRSDHFVDAVVKLDPDGTIDVLYDNEPIFSNVPTTLTNVAGRFAFGARTGSLVDNHFIDDLHIVTRTSPGAFVDTFSPVGNDASPSVMLDILLRDFKTKVKPGSVQLSFDDTPVTAEIFDRDGTTLVHYEPAEVFAPESSHQVTVQFVDTGEPAMTNDFSYSFRITSQIAVSK